MKYAVVGLVLLLAACAGGTTNPVTGQQNPTLIYGKGKCVITGMGSAGLGVASGQNGFMASADCADGAYLYIGPPPTGFAPPAIKPMPAVQ